MKSATEIIAKLRKPPAAHNWVKTMWPRQDDTAQALHRFAINPPRTSLLQTVGICTQIVVDGISLEQALKCVDGIKDPAAADRARWILKAFYPFAKEHGWEGIQIFRDMVEFYKVSAGVRVPVKPAFVLNDDGKLTPYFLICWSRMDLTVYQRCILSTLITEAILSLEDFYGSDAVIICTPTTPFSKRERQVFTWKASDFPVLDLDEKQDLFDRYAAALDDAERMIIESLS
jgi:hypothetical protein